MSIGLGVGSSACFHSRASFHHHHHHRSRLSAVALRRRAGIPVLEPAFLRVKRGGCWATDLTASSSSFFRAPRALFHFHVDHGALLQDAGATMLVTAGAYALVLAFDKLTMLNVVEQTFSRKLVHILSGLLYMFSWPIFSTSITARFFAALVPFLNCVRLVVYGLSLANDEGLVKSVTREGNPEELLRGPLYYVLILILCAVIFWRESPIGVISLAMMAGGDGFADIMGRRFGSLKLPYNQHKSWIGSISMFLSGFLISMGMLYYFSALGYFQLDWVWTVEKVALVSLVATVVESFPNKEGIDDNISVPITSMLMSLLFFQLPPSSH
ncbi:PREDICTED: probable phytol kinase, chloroplastic [Nelumbo nucifera]|uniref:phytol kinase n=2 Tax=Nelumbo nucifera TaxID=4432 RepID=A0A1U8BML7_NELNU|nr:PREDICTED: probable phytol kinase, chloroplastic [Nelumbo nucifera]DAD28663.1 TPA_asm: hypothetical protein HUJ06_030131 [Nelumbo nucifera]